MKITKAIGGAYCKSIGEIEIRNTETRLTWMPGIKPVNVPARTPINKAMTNSISIGLVKLNSF